MCNQFRFWLSKCLWCSWASNTLSFIIHRHLDNLALKVIPSWCNRKPWLQITSNQIDLSIILFKWHNNSALMLWYFITNSASISQHSFITLPLWIKYNLPPNEHQIQALTHVCYVEKYDLAALLDWLTK